MNKLGTVQLLPQSPETQIPTHLKPSELLSFLIFLTEQTIYALKFFYIDKKYYEFDPHVGETSCQIRAYKLLLLSSHTKNVTPFLVIKKIDDLKNLLIRMRRDFLSHKTRESKPRDKSKYPIQLEEFIEKNGYYVDISKNEFFLILSYILTNYKIKSSNDDIGINYLKLMTDSGLSKNAARRLVHVYQMELSKISCEFILDLVDETPNLPFNRNILDSLRAIDEEGRHVLPCYWVIKTIYGHMVHNPKPIQLLIEHKNIHDFKNKISLNFNFSKEKNEFVYSERSTLTSLDEPAFIIQASAYNIDSNYEYIYKIIKLGLKNLIFLNMAIHPQYSGKKLKSFSTNPFNLIVDKNAQIETKEFQDEFLSTEKNANMLGCSNSNPSLLYINHIYCDNVNRQIDHTESSISWDVQSNKSKMDIRIISVA